MSPANGHANDSAHIPTTAVQQIAPPTSDTNIPPALTLTATKIKELIANLEVPFHPSVIEWRVTNTSKGGTPRGQVMPYADQRAYTDRLNTLVTPAGWTRRYAIHTSANFERSKDQKIVAKVLVTCELTIFGLGSHSATGEEWADDDNAATAAEAQSFKRACSCFGLGRYLYYFAGAWVDLDDRKRPKTVPELGGWATPEGWRRGLRPYAEDSKPAERTSAGTDGHGDGHRNGNGASDRGASLVREIEQMEQAVGKRMYRGLLKTLARLWNPKDIQDPAIQKKVLAHIASSRSRFPPTGCGARQSRPGSADTNTPLSELAVSRPGRQPSNLACDRACTRNSRSSKSSETVTPSGKETSPVLAPFALPFSSAHQGDWLAA